MTAIEIIDKLPFKSFKSRKAHVEQNRRAILNAGCMPIKSIQDEAGNCIFCGECGRCPGYHTLDEVQKWREHHTSSHPEFILLHQESCKHPPNRVFAWTAYDNTLCSGCCNCGKVLSGMAVAINLTEAQ